MQAFANAGAGELVLALADRVIENRAYLSRIDGEIGDGDHGVNMAKGFGIAAERIRGAGLSLSGGFDVLGGVLMTEIGGSMGPLYGVMFSDFAEAIADRQEVDAPAFAAMLRRGLDAVQSIGSARRGDKTLIDAFEPAIEAFEAATAAGRPFADALDDLARAAEAGRDSTRDLMARVGRASRLGERSIGILDAGATSCALILCTLAGEVRARLGQTADAGA